MRVKYFCNSKDANDTIDEDPALTMLYSVDPFDAKVIEMPSSEAFPITDNNQIGSQSARILSLRVGLWLVVTFYSIR